MQKIKKMGAALALLTAAAGAQANVLFNDNFDANTVAWSGGLGQAPNGWNVSGGTVDLVGAGTLTTFAGGASIGTGHGKFIDLDGSGFNAGLLSYSLNLQAGTTYTLSFELAGNNRGLGSDSDSVKISFGNATLNTALSKRDGWASYSLNFTPDASQAYSFSFANSGGDNYGALLDNVSVTSAVPEPQTYALMGAGLLAVLMLNRRRNKAQR